MTSHSNPIRIPVFSAFALFLFLITPSLAGATRPPRVSEMARQADSAYRARDYIRAVSLYGQIVQDSPSATAYYNLGNAQWRIQDTARAICNYQRALRLDPSHEDARFNLQLCQERLQDRFNPPPQMFFTTMLSDCIDRRSALTWGWWAFIAFACSIVGLGMVRLMPSKWGRRTGRTLWIGGTLACLLLNIFAAWKSHTDSSRHYAVIAGPQSVYAEPNAAAAVRRPLHTGTTVRILETRHGGWQQIEMPDGEGGWICGQTLPVGEQ